MDVSLMLPAALPDRRIARELAAMVHEGRAARLYQGDSLAESPFTQLAGVVREQPVPCGLGVVVMPLRHPVTVAMEADSLAVASRAPVLLGLGPGAPELQHLLLGERYRSPLAATRGYLRALRVALNHRTDDDASSDGDRDDAPGDGGYGAVPLPRLQGRVGEVVLGLGVLRPRMAHLAGEIADAVIMHAPPPSYLTDVLLAAARAGASRTGRAGRVRFVVVLPVAHAQFVPDPVRALAPAHAAHVMAPHYRAMYRAAGVVEEGTSLAESIRRLVRSGTFGYGSDEDLARVLQRLRGSGVDEVVLNVSGTYFTGGRAATTATVARLLDLHGPP